jgi:hypothetical protein
MTATSTPTLDMPPNMRDVSARIANYARENLEGVDVVSVGPLFGEIGEMASGGVQYSVVVIAPERGGKDFAPYYVMLDVAQDPFMAAVYRKGLIVALEEFFGRVQVFGNELTLAKYCQEEWPSEGIGRLVADLMRTRGLN